MTLVIKDDGKSFEPVPTGTFRAVCVGVFDLGIRETFYGEKHQIFIRWETEEKIQEGDNKGKRFCVNKFYTKNLGSESNLRKDLESWRGKPYTVEELKAGINIGAVVGKSCLLSILHTKKDDKVIAKISAISSLPKGTEPLIADEILKEEPEWLTKLKGRMPEHEEGEIRNVEDLPF